MKKYIVWILMIAMTLSLCACRPEAQTGGAGSSPEGGTGVSEEVGGLNEQVDENAEDTETGAPLGAEGEESAENTLIPEESEEGTEVTITEPAENEEEAEVTLPATTTEDPALRAEADRIRKEQGYLEYAMFCREKDIKCYSNYSIDEDYAEDHVVVRLKISASTYGAKIPDFSCVDYERIEESNYYGTEKNPDFARRFTIYLKTKTKEEVLSTIQVLEKLDYVQSATVDYANYPE